MQPAEAARVATALQTLIARWSREWTISYDHIEPKGCVLAARHPASHGLDFDLSELEADQAIEELPRLLAGVENELRAVQAAPRLQHTELVLGIRSLAKVFGWSNREVGGLTSLLGDKGILTQEEAQWLAEFEGS